MCVGKHSPWLRFQVCNPEQILNLALGKMAPISQNFVNTKSISKSKALGAIVGPQCCVFLFCSVNYLPHIYRLFLSKY